ncbi:MAG: hypothetical protein UT66_C0004G0032 [candidate division CPR2 bacterium GW2011_GWC1_39_9]|uniref:HD domain-containing protein n=1 Tax=candidate division CPR2 bacterium GW2011_GWC2_39_10 TaxID=1618345 RepID=A0A0G0M3J0_UNCC2|nr:MAG: hypothetical protein UT18_C0006G0018 [candidate division CPR2 bacterium GW2011_GWC2_39_10]KKR36037.1 MAG: hypothetical protein UT66_C0004G0032 [candidate division CPR2 bacterium GW2011_GWC1_39_9]
MKTLILLEAKKIALDMFEKVEPVEHGDFLRIHSEKVGKVAVMIARIMQLDDEIFEIAGWIHDIGYSENFENHADFSISILERMGYELSDVLSDCVSNHGNGMDPKTIEGKIFQVADKLSIFDIEIIGSMLKNGSFPLEDGDIDFLKMMSENALKLVKNFSK